jgi:hypothetical protein
LVEAGQDGGSGQVGSSGATSNDTSLFDQPNTPAAIFPPGTKKAILRFEVIPFCAEGDDAGKFLGHIITWEHHQDKGATGTIQNVASSTGQPSSDFIQALNIWVNAKFAGKLPQPMPSPCP